MNTIVRKTEACASFGYSWQPLAFPALLRGSQLPLVNPQAS
jgi:hypothetical protein